jgi:hypothetical protein
MLTFESRPVLPTAYFGLAAAEIRRIILPMARPIPILLLLLATLPNSVRGAAPIRVKDLDYIHRTYYFIADHPIRYDHSSHRVFRDDRNPTNDNLANAQFGRARLDPLSPQGGSNPEILGKFDVLVLGVDCEVIYPYIVASGAEIPVLVMAVPEGLNNILGVSYVEDVGGVPVAVGNSDLAATDSTLGKYPGERLLKAIKPTYDLPSTLSDGAYDPSDPWYPILSYELRNFYRLGLQNIDQSRTTITVRRRDNAFSVDPDTYHGEPLLRLLGLDQIGESIASPPDGRVDGQFLDPAGGVLFFPDLHPFDPDTAAGDCSTGNGGFLCLDDLGRNPLRYCNNWDECIANPFVYYMRNPDPLTQSRFFIELVVAPLPTEELLHPNHPNPFRASTTIEFETPTAGTVRLFIYDIHGRLVRQIEYPDMTQGPHSAFWGGGNSKGFAVPSGVYLCRLEGPGFVRTRRMVLLR